MKYVKIISKEIFRKKTIFYNFIFVFLLTITVFIISTYKNSVLSYKKNIINMNPEFNSLTIYPNESENFEMVKEKIKNIPNIKLITKNYAYDAWGSINLENNKSEDNTVRLLVANNDTIPKIIKGKKFSNNEEGFLICPRYMFFSTDDNILNNTNKNDYNDMKKYLNKNITFKYHSNKGTIKFEKEFKIIGIFDNPSYKESLFTCYTTIGALNEINENAYKDDIDVDGTPSIDNQTSIFIRINDLTKIDNVKKELTKIGYKADDNAIIIPEYFENINSWCTNIELISFIILFVLLVILFIKYSYEEKEYYKLLEYLGYNNKDRIIISTLSYFLILLISFILSMAVFSLFFVFANIFIKNHPFIMNGFKIIFDFNALFKIAIVVLLTTILCLISNLIIIKDDNNV